MNLFLRTLFLLSIALSGFSVVCMESTEKGKEKMTAEEEAEAEEKENGTQDEGKKKNTNAGKPEAKKKILREFDADAKEVNLPIIPEGDWGQINILAHTYSTRYNHFPFITLVLYDRMYTKQETLGKIASFELRNADTGEIVIESFGISADKIPESDKISAPAIIGSFLEKKGLLLGVKQQYWTTRGTEVVATPACKFHLVLYMDKDLVRTSYFLMRNVISSIKWDFSRKIYATDMWPPKRWWYTHVKGYTLTKTEWTGALILEKKLNLDTYFKPTSLMKRWITRKTVGVGVAATAGLVGLLKTYQWYTKRQKK